MVADGAPALAWVLIAPAPVPYINEMKESAAFYANRVIKDDKGIIYFYGRGFSQILHFSHVK